MIPRHSEEQLRPSFGIITALPKEYAAVRTLLEDCREYSVESPGIVRQYTLGEIPASNGGIHSVVLALLVDMGNNLAAIQSTTLIEHFPNISTLIMVGIAGGIPFPEKPDDHVRLGDIAITNQQGIVQYDFVKESSEDVTYRNPPRPPSVMLLGAAKLLEAGELRGERPWLEHIKRALQTLKGISRPSSRKDTLCATTDPLKVVTHPRDTKRVPNQPRVFSGPIASANKLLKNPSRRDLLRDKFGVKAVEMEGSGVADASWFQSKEYFIVRGVCDYCDSHKGDEWQNYAAVVAAAYARALLESVPGFSQRDTENTMLITSNAKPDSSIISEEGVLSSSPVYTLDLYGTEQAILDRIYEWKLVSTHPSAELSLSGDHIGIGSIQSTTFNLPPINPVRNCRVECEIRILEDGGDKTNWAGIRLRGFGLDVGLGYLVYLRSSGTVELYSVGEILEGKDKIIIENTRENWTNVSVEIANSSIIVFVNGKKHFSYTDERFCGKDYVFLHTFGTKSLFRNFKIYSLDKH